ncbi:MAG: uroporphyrinogen-III synthase, partial [Paracoccaceae bacterium]
MPLILLTRPQAQSEAFAAEIAHDGWRSLIWPVIEITPLLSAPPDLAGVDALIFTSARAVEALARFGAPPPLPAWCVGPATAAAARRAGLGPVIAAEGDGEALVAALAMADGRLLHIRGRDASVDILGALRRAGRDAREVVAYAAEPGREPEARVGAAIAAGEAAGVALFSPRSAALLAGPPP